MNSNGNYRTENQTQFTADNGDDIGVQVVVNPYNFNNKMITESDSFNTLELKNYFVILPNTFSENKILTTKKYYKKNFKAKPVKKGFKYNSGNNPDFLTKKELKLFFN